MSLLLLVDLVVGTVAEHAGAASVAAAVTAIAVVLTSVAAAHLVRAAAVLPGLVLPVLGISLTDVAGFVHSYRNCDPLLGTSSVKLTWLVLGEDPATRFHRVEQFTTH